MTVTGSNRQTSASKQSRRRYWLLGILGAIALGVFLLIGAPASNRIDTGSTWGTAPDGYGAWYAYMEEQGASIKRWQKPLDQLIDETASQGAPRTLIRVIPPALSTKSPGAWQSGLSDWIERGDRLIVLSQRGRVTAAKFSTLVDSETGKVTVETRRRYGAKGRDRPLYEQEGTEIKFEPALNGEPISAPRSELAQRSDLEALLADDYGAVVWRRLEEPNLIWSTTPFLGANAYQEADGNFAFLSALVQEGQGTVWVDEYLHGYKDRDVVIEEVAGTWLGYLAKTPLLIASVQLGVILLIALAAQNRSVGSKQPLPSEQVNNSEAYIKALAGVLHKANNQDFLVETLTGAERKALARSLGLGESAVSSEALSAAWQQSTGRSAAELAVLQARPRGGAALQTWLRQLQSLVPKVTQKAGQTVSGATAEKDVPN